MTSSFVNDIFGPPPPAEPDARDIDDVDATRQAIFDNVYSAVEKKFPVENERYQLRVSKLGWDSDKPYSLADQKRAIMARQSLGRRLRGTWELVDKATGQVADKRTTTIAQVPYMTQRGTFINGGREYGVANQFRLRSGVYARRKQDGELEAHFNLLPGTGRSFRIRMNPATGVFFADVGQASIPLYPVLKAMGVSDEMLKERWGEEQFAQNQPQGRNVKAVSNAYAKLVGGKDPKEQHAQALTDYVNKMRLDPDVTMASLGKYVTHNKDGAFEMSPEVMVAATQKLVGINRGIDDPDDRDSLANQELMSPEDFFAERITKDSGGIIRNILFASTYKNKLTKVPVGALTPHMNAVLMGSGVANALEEINPIESLDNLHRVTRMGQGGIGSIDSIPLEARGVQPTYLGYVDPFRSTECYAEDMEVLGARRWLKWQDVTAKTRLLTWQNGEFTAELPTALVAYDYKGLMYTYDDGDIAYSVTPDHRMWVSATPEAGYHFDQAADVYRSSNLFVLRGNKKPHHLDIDGYGTEQYQGKVYCATVPGGLLVVRRGATAGFVCGNSEKVGVDNRLARGLRKGRDGKLYRQLTDARTGQPNWVSAIDAARSTVAFPGELEGGAPAVRAISNGRIAYVPREKVDYGLREPDDMHDNGVNLVPFMNATQGNRLMTAGKMMLQAMSLKNRESPRVFNRVGGTDESYEDRMGGKMGGWRADAGGTVLAVTPDSITIQGDDGRKREVELYNNFPFNRKSYYYNKPTVTPGQRVEPGQLLASSNYTDDKGSLALGMHLRTAMMPYKGLAHEDAYVMSESAARKMAHEAMYTVDFDKTDGVEAGMRKYISLFPGVYDREQLSRIDDGGVIKPGTIVRKGDPLVLAVGKPRPRGEGQAVHRNVNRPQDATVTWEHDYDGEVTDAFVGDDGGVRVAVRASVPLQSGDKISGLHGDKGVVGRVVPDQLMPHDRDGNPYELIQNPLTLPTRKNPAQVYSMLLNKIAGKTGKPYLMDKFHKGALTDFVAKELRKNGFNEDGTDDLYDPETGRELKKVLTGDKYIVKLHHTSESKAGARDMGGYDSEGNPQRGGGDGAKSVTGLGLNALISHNANEVLRDMKEHKASRNDEFWRAFRLGRPTPSPDVPLVYRKMMSHLLAAGVNLDKRGDYTHLMAMTDKDVLDLAEDRVVSSPETIDERTMQPIKGGLFDRGMFGGVGGERWARIKLPEPMPSPVMEDAIKTTLGLTGKEFDELLSGRQRIGQATGGAAMKAALDKIDVENEIKVARETVRSGSKSARDKAVKKLRLLETAKRQGIKPGEWMITTVPVLPPVFRPISKMTNNTSIVSDPNYLYQDLLHNAGSLSESAKALGAEGSAEERLNTYKALKAVVGLGDPVHPKLQEKGVEGLLRHVFGKGAPKFGMFQRRVIGMSVDKSGRAVIAGDPDLDMDSIGMPEHQAWEMYKSFVLRNLVRRGFPATRAAEEIEDQTELARSELVKEMERRPILATRAPGLHRYNIMSFKPKLTAGKVLILSPLVLGGFTADFDGDAMSMHVPVSDEAVKEAYEKLLPSKHLRNVARFDVHYTPTQEFLLGLYQATRKRKASGKAHRFASMEDLRRAYRRGEVALTDQVVIGK
jgi:DNA-directed RNA polymerase beta subunit